MSKKIIACLWRSSWVAPHRLGYGSEKSLIEKKDQPLEKWGFGSGKYGCGLHKIGNYQLNKLIKIGFFSINFTESELVVFVHTDPFCGVNAV